MNEHNSNKENCKALIPHLRFPEFKDSGKWEVEEVGNVFEVTRGYVLPMNLVSDEQSESNPFPVYSSQTKNNGLAGYYKDFLYEDAITWTTDGANAGDVNFRKGKFYCTNVCGVLINKNGYSNHCVAAIINSVAKKYVSYVGNPKLMNGVMSKIKIPLPSLPEQQKIATCLSSIDEVIAGERQRLERLKAHKKGLLQNLFPREGETVPKLRFQEFENSSEWEMIRLGEVSENVMYGMNAAAVEFDGVNKYLRITDIDENTRMFNPNPLTSPAGEIDEKYLVKVGDILFARTGASVGKSYFHQKENGKIYFAGFLIRFSIKGAVPYFVYLQTLTTQYQKWVSAISIRSGQPGINSEEYKSYPLLIPKNLQEQQKIADCLSSLDDLIQAQQQKIELLEQHKKGLLQGLFPNVNDVDNG